MQTKIFVSRLILLSLFAVPASNAANVILNDPFTDGGRTNGSDTLDTAWFLSSTASSTTLTVTNDTVINSGNAMRLNTTVNFRRFFGAFDSAITIAQGETLQLSFEYRFHETANGVNFFRFGLYNNGGTPTTADGSPNDNNDFGYASSTNPGADAANGTIVQSENSGDAVLGGSAPGALITVGTAGASVDVGTSLPGSAVFSVTRNLDDSITLSSSINGQSAATGTITTSPLTYTFHQVAIGLGGASSDFSVDNVNVSVIPEPSSLLLSALGVIAAAGYRKRK